MFLLGSYSVFKILLKNNTYKRRSRVQAVKLDCLGSNPRFSPSSCMTMSVGFHHRAVAWFHDNENGHDNSTSLFELLGWLDELIQVRHFQQCLAPRKHSIKVRSY